MSFDPEDDQPQPAQSFEFRGTPLAKYSFGHRAALCRMGDLTDYEFCTYLVRILLLDPLKVDAIRGADAITAFRIEAGQWADKEGVSRAAGLVEIQSLADQILTEVAKAESLEPVATPAKKKASRAPRRGNGQGT